MNVLAQIAAHFAAPVASLEVDENTGFATTFRGQVCNVWTVKVPNASAAQWWNVWTHPITGRVLAAYEA